MARRGGIARSLVGRLFHLWRGLTSRRGTGKPPFPRRIRRVNRGSCERRISLYYVASPIRLLKPRDVSNHCPDRYRGPRGRHDDLVCAAGAGADRQYLFRSGAAPARGYSARRQGWGAATATRRRRRASAGTAAGPPAADAESSAAGAGRAAAWIVPDTAAGAAARHHRHSAKYPARHCRRTAAARRAPAARRHAAGPAAGTAPAHQGWRRAADAGQPAARRRGGHRAAGAEDRQQEGEFLRAGQDHRAHHQFRRGYRRNRPVRRAAGENRGLLYPPRDRGRQHRRLRRGRRDHAAGRGEADFFRLDVCGEPGPARRRASDLRYLADRLQRPGNHHRHRGARAAETRRRRPSQNARRRRSRRCQRSAPPPQPQFQQQPPPPPPPRSNSSPAACSGFSGSGTTGKTLSRARQ